MYGIKYRKPEEMKDSGIEWLGRIPGDWRSVRLKYLSRYKASNVDKLTRKEEYPVLLCNYVDVYKNDYITDKIDFMQASANKQEIKKFLLMEGYILITKDSESPDDIAIPAYVEKSLENVLCGYHLAIIEVNFQRLNAKYLFMFLSSHGVRSYFSTRAKGVTRYSLGVDSFKNIPVPEFSLHEQQKISNFLDIKTAQFDSVISKKELLIQKLQEAKNSLISEVVTGKVKIVDGRMVKRQPEEMKDSGVEWLGMIPKDWEVKRIKFLIFESSRRSISGKEEHLSMSQKYGLIKSSEMETIPNQSSNLKGNKICKKGDLVFNKLKSHLGVFSVANQEGIVSPDYAVYRSQGKAITKYLEYLFKTTLYINEFNKFSKGVGVGLTRLYTGDLFNIYSIYPSPSEQNKIVDFINTKIEAISNLTKLVDNQIQKLKEAKQSLISEAVTGKIDMRDWEIIEEGELQ